jgi:hypothetical protein
MGGGGHCVCIVWALWQPSDIDPSPCNEQSAAAGTSVQLFFPLWGNLSASSGNFGCPRNFYLCRNILRVGV